MSGISSKLRSLASVALVVLMSIAATCRAQTFRGGISGLIEDPTGAVVAGAHVEAIDEGTGVVHTTISSSAGDYAFPDLPLGSYRVEGTMAGFQVTKVAGVHVNAGQIYGLKLKLSLEQQTANVEVTAAALALDTETTEKSTVLTSAVVQEVPLNGRNFQQFIALQPGYGGYSNGGNASVNGTRVNQVNYQVDGVDNNRPWTNLAAAGGGGGTGAPASVLPMDATEQVSILTQYSPEAGRDPGAVVNVVIKSGTNKLHGTGYYYNRNEALAEPSPFLPVGVTKPLNRGSNYGFAVGGPLIKNRTFFFGAYERKTYSTNPGKGATMPGVGYQALARQLLQKYAVAENSVSDGLLTLWPAYALTSTSASTSNFFSPDNGYGHNFNILLKIDHTFNPNNTLSLRGYVSQGYEVEPVPSGSLVLPYYQEENTRVQNYDIVYNTVLKPTLTNQLLLGVNYDPLIYNDFQHNQNPASFGLVTGSPYLGAPAITIGSFNGVGTTTPSGHNDATGHVTDIMSWLKGKHQFRFGGEYRKVYVNDFITANSRGSLTFNGNVGPWKSDTSVNGTAIDTYSKALADFFAGYTSSSSISLGNQQRNVYENSWNAFGGDIWKIARGLTLNYGFRYDYQSPPYNNDGNLSTFNANKGGVVYLGNGISSLYPKIWSNISPRVGFAYTPSFNQSLVLRGGFGLYFDAPSLNAFFSTSAGNGGPTGVNGNLGGNTPVTSVTQQTKTIVAGQSFFQNATSATTYGVFSLSPTFGTPATYNFYMQIEQSLGQAAILQLGYVGSKSDKQIGVVDINPAALSTAGTVVQATRPYYAQFPNYSVIDQLETNINSNYTSLQAMLKSANWHGVTSQISYTWSHNLDDASRIALPQINSNVKSDYGNSSFDTRNNLTGFVSYAIPGSSHGPKGLTHGWSANVLYNFHGGQPFTIATKSADNTGVGDSAQLANQVSNPFTGVSHALIPTTVLGATPTIQWINPAAFVAPAKGTYGTQRRNQIFGQGFADADVSVIKDTHIRERVILQLRAEVYNVSNRLNLGSPSATYSSGGSYGIISATVGAGGSAAGLGPGEPRNTQLAVKVMF